MPSPPEHEPSSAAAGLRTLAPKLGPPASRGQQVLREALLEQMLQAGAARLVLVCAPAGFGKTTALEQYRERLTQQARATAWLTLDAQDNDRSRFLAGLQATWDQLQAQQQATGGPGARPPREDTMGEVALTLLARLAALPSPFVLFLDDVETVQDASVLALLSELLECLPRHGQLVMGTRSRPALPLARLRARGQLLEIDADHLRFSLLETTRFFAPLVDALPAEPLRRLHEQSEGWVTALWRAALALDRHKARHGDHDLLIEPLMARFNGSSLALADYLAEEVLAGLDTPSREFLLCTSVLKHLNPALCQALVPGQDAGALLQRLASANLFLTPILDAPGSYRYHALFAGFLRAQLMREAPLRVQALHRAAAGWYEAQQRPVPAIDHALEGGDLPRALRLLDSHAMPLLMQGRLRLLARWLQELPADALGAHPRLHAIGLWALALTAGPLAAAVRMNDSGLEHSQDAQARQLVCALPPTLLNMQDRQDEAYAYGMPLLEQRGTPKSFADSALANAVASAATVLGRYPEARRLLDASRRALGQAPNPFSAMYAESLDGIIDLLEGRLRQAGARFRLAVRPASDAGTSDSQAASALGGNAWAGLLYACSVYEAGELDPATQLLHVYLPMVCDACLPDHMILGHVMLARIAVSRHDLDQAQQVLTALEALGHQRQLPRVVASARLERARMALLQGDAQGAEAELERANDAALWQRVARQCHLANDLESLPLSRCRQALLLGSAETALALIEHEVALATAGSSHRRVLLLRLLEAMAWLRLGDTSTALRRFQLVMKVCAREGFVRLVVDEGPLAGALLQRWLAQQPGLGSDPLLADHARRVLAAFGPLPELDTAADATPEHLTPQELRVLQDVAEGLSNDAVAERHGISRSTVRTHLRNISAKLQAANRTQAVAIARRLGWLS